MHHYGPEPPWRGYSRWYGEWVRGPELWEDGHVWTWRAPDNPGSFLGLLSRELDKVREDIHTALNEPFLPRVWNLAELHDQVTVLG